MPAAIIGAVGTIGGALISANAANKAADVQAAAGRRAEARIAPFANVGQGAVTTLGQLFGINQAGEQTGAPDFSSFYSSPDYKFALDQGVKALERSNAAQGQLNSGNNLRDLMSFGQGLATQNYGNYVNRLLQLSSLGANAAGNQANQIGNIGQAQASGIVGSANALNQGLSGAANNLMLYNLLNQNQSAYGNTALNATGQFGSSWTPITI